MNDLRRLIATALLVSPTYAECLIDFRRDYVPRIEPNELMIIGSHLMWQRSARRPRIGRSPVPVPPKTDFSIMFTLSVKSTGCIKIDLQKVENLRGIKYSTRLDMSPWYTNHCNQDFKTGDFYVWELMLSEPNIVLLFFLWSLVMADFFLAKGGPWSNGPPNMTLTAMLYL